MMLLPFDTIVRSLAFDERASTMQLRPWQWQFLLGADGRTRLGDLARICGIDFETAADLVHETEALGLIDIVTLSLASYRAAAAAGNEGPVAIDVPRKAVSVSFDAFSSMLGGWDSPPEASVARDAVAHERVELETTIVHDAIANDPLPESVPIAIEFPTQMEPLLGDRSELPPVDTVSEPVPPLEPAPIVAPAKSVTFSLSADSFGLPREPFDTPSYDAHVDLMPADAVPAPAKKDDVHGPYVQSDGAPATGAVAELPATDATSDSRANGDLTGVVLRALGLKK